MANYESGAKMTTSKNDKKSGAISNESGAMVDESGAKSNTSKNSNNIYKKETFFPLKDLIYDYKNGKGKLKPYYLGDPMIWKKLEQKWYVIDKYNRWLEYADKKEKIEWK
jgi:hypothetical protein